MFYVVRYWYIAILHVQYLSYTKNALILLSLFRFLLFIMVLALFGSWGSEQSLPVILSSVLA
jgi:hypothetical protein